MVILLMVINWLLYVILQLLVIIVLEIIVGYFML
jgi:hypothetical protein